MVRRDLICTGPEFYGDISTGIFERGKIWTWIFSTWIFSSGIYLNLKKFELEKFELEKIWTWTHLDMEIMTWKIMTWELWHGKLWNIFEHFEHLNIFGLCVSWINIFVLDITCQILGDGCKLESFIVPFGHRVGRMYIFGTM